MIAKLTLLILCTIGAKAGLQSRAEGCPSHGIKLQGSEVSVSGMVRIPAGYYRPFYVTKVIESARIESFYMDAVPVTNEEFLQFVKANTEWARSAVSLTLAAPGYLKKWRGDFEIGNHALDKLPVVDVSWFAAHAYARWRHKRLPTTEEWEYAALAPITKPINAVGTARNQLILEWYCKQDPRHLQPAGTANENAYGIHDLFGQTWEWVEDFNSLIIPTESGSNQDALCGAVEAGTSDPSEYATFLRFVMRNSLKANDATDQLGFRCVK